MACFSCYAFESLRTIFRRWHDDHTSKKTEIKYALSEESLYWSNSNQGASHLLTRNVTQCNGSKGVQEKVPI